jgi:dolichol-phosphate mannosyltransferase
MGILLSLAGMGVGVYVVLEWFKGINHFPMTILTVLLIMVGFEIFMFGVISDILLAFHREILHEIQLLQQPRKER